MNIPWYIQERTRQFYEWEKRGRGWQVVSEAVELEPAYAPFFFTYTTPPIDDGKRPTPLSTIAEWFRGTKINEESSVPSPTIDLEPFPFVDTSPLVFLLMLLPKAFVPKESTLEALCTALSYTKLPVSIELRSTEQAITLQLTVRTPDAGYVTGQLRAFIPGCIVQDVTSDGETIAENEGSTVCVDFGLAEEFMRPLSMKTSTDRYISLFAILDNLHVDERVSFQILFSGLINNWSDSIVDAVTTHEGDSFFYDAPEMPQCAKEKVLGRMCAVSIRLLTQAPTVDDAIALAEMVCIPLLQTTASSYNSLVPLVTDEYDFNMRIDDILDRTSHRLGMLLNIRELCTMVPFPSASLSSKLQVDHEHTQAAPDGTKGHAYTLGINTHHGSKTRVSLNVSQRLKHLHIIGATGTGKSTLLLQLLIQDINQGNGVALLDPHGDLFDTVLAHIPEHRINDVIIIDPSDTDYPVGCNILTAHSDIEKEILASDLVSVFKKFSSSWGDQMNSVFANAILAFLESTEGGNLSDLRRFLIEKPYRDSVLATVKDEHIVYYWQKEYPLLKNSSVGSILTRLDSFLRPKIIRNMVVQQKSLDFEQLMDSKKVLLVKVSHGLIGAENSYLLGSFIVSKIQQAAMGRQAKAKELRSEFYLYIDEFQYFTTDSMGVILSGARKYGLGLVLAHQSMQQLQKEDANLAHAVIANAGTRICFRLGDHDARLFSTSFASFGTEDLQRLDTGKAIVRIERSDHDFTLTTLPFEAPSQHQNVTDSIIAHSRKTYATPKETIQTEPIHESEPVDTPVYNAPPRSASKKSPSPPPPSEPPIQESDTLNQLIKHKQQSQHRYLQTLIKKIAESKGYKATIEKSTPDGKGKIDIALEKDGFMTACEISVTTDAEWEWHNLQKCLAAGCTMVVMACSEKRTIDALTQKCKRLDEQIRSKILICSPESYMATLQQDMLDTGSSEKVIKGYRVKVSYNQEQQTDIEQKQSQIIRIIDKNT